MESTVPGVFVVGDGAGVAGSAVALLEGHLAGLVVANRRGRLLGRDYAREASRARGRLLHLAGFRRGMDEPYPLGPGPYTPGEDQTAPCPGGGGPGARAPGAPRDGRSPAPGAQGRQPG